MTSWQLTKGLSHLRDQVNEAFPHRSKASDGTIGDTAHMAETSGHNPDDTPGSKAEYNDGDGIPEVRAWDMTSTLNEPGMTAQRVVDHILALPNISSVLRYVIYNRVIYEASNGWGGRAYTGASAHTEHIHFSGARTQASDNNTTFNYKLEELVMPTAEEIATAVWAAADTAPIRNGRTLGGTLNALAVNSSAATGLPAAVAAIAGALPDPDTFAAAVVAKLPSVSDPVSQDEVTAAVAEAFREAFSSTPAS